MTKPKIWCVNFDHDDNCLQHGIENKLWMMQYQYSHDGHAYQGHPKEIGATTKNWRRLAQIRPGDFFVAYLPQNTFYAIGKVRIPRKPQTHNDTINRVTDERTHSKKGIVKYTDVFYEDYTDNWGLQVTNSYSGKGEVWKYNQRIDVDVWDYYVRDGVQVRGLDQVPVNEKICAVFQIRNQFFEAIKKALKETGGKGTI